MRERLCSSPTPQHGGSNCSGPHIQTKDCNSHPCSEPRNVYTPSLCGACPVDGQWSSWTPWSRCSVSCGAGLQSRYRFCSSPQRSGSGLPCLGPHREDQVCIVPPCDLIKIFCNISSVVDGAWSRWTWTECSVPCGGGVTFRRRLCDNPAPQAGGRGCLGTAEQKKDCNMQMCTGSHSVGPWLLWSQWSSCSVSCGGGQQSRSRTCTSPPCHGVSRQSKIGCEHGMWNCSLELCPIDGGLTAWGPWSPCSLSCGGLGVKVRSRTCTEPAPAHGGRDCQGPRQETTYCQAPDSTCPPKNCSWTEWGTWGSCSRSCGVGNLEHRFCNIRPCRGQSNALTSLCETVDGGWSRWSPWSRCDQRCGGGRSIRTRACSSPPPKNGGRKCLGEKNQVKPCNTKPCGEAEQNRPCVDHCDLSTSSSCTQTKPH
uniref:Uncharacterized protein n=1 Tax=Poecilia latipinna TaxID=48699 RepID=A0A3B3U592_9TELE